MGDDLPLHHIVNHGLYGMKRKTIEEICQFRTERLSVCAWSRFYADKESKDHFHKQIIRILTPEVTKALPDGWQHIKRSSDAEKWVKDRADECHFIVVQEKSSGEIVGFIFLYEMGLQGVAHELRFGYLLSESVWGKGLGTELIKGLIDWCQTERNIASLSGGVEKDNIGSIKVLEKNGFSLSKNEDQSSEVLFYEYAFKMK